MRFDSTLATQMLLLANTGIGRRFLRTTDSLTITIAVIPLHRFSR